MFQRLKYWINMGWRRSEGLWCIFLEYGFYTSKLQYHLQRCCKEAERPVLAWTIDTNCVCWPRPLSWLDKNCGKVKDVKNWANFPMQKDSWIPEVIQSPRIKRNLLCEFVKKNCVSGSFLLDTSQVTAEFYLSVLPWTSELRYSCNLIVKRRHTLTTGTPHR